MLPASIFRRTHSVTVSLLMWLCVWQLQHNLCYWMCPELGSNASCVNLFSDTFSNSFSADVVVCLKISAQHLLLNVSEIRVQTLRASTVFRTRSVTASLLMWLCVRQYQHNVRVKRFARQPFFRTCSRTVSLLMRLCVWQFQHNLCYWTCPKLVQTFRA